MTYSRNRPTVPFTMQLRLNQNRAERINNHFQIYTNSTSPAPTGNSSSPTGNPTNDPEENFHQSVETGIHVEVSRGTSDNSNTEPMEIDSTVSSQDMRGPLPASIPRAPTPASSDVAKDEAKEEDQTTQSTTEQPSEHSSYDNHGKPRDINLYPRRDAHRTHAPQIARSMATAVMATPRMPFTPTLPTIKLPAMPMNSINTLPKLIYPTTPSVRSSAIIEKVHMLPWGKFNDYLEHQF